MSQITIDAVYPDRETNKFLIEVFQIFQDRKENPLKKLKKKDRPKNYIPVQTHHIIPVSYFQNNNLPIDNSNENKITLTPCEHIKVHFLLMKYYQQKGDKRMMCIHGGAVLLLISKKPSRNKMTIQILKTLDDFSQLLIDEEELNRIINECSIIGPMLIKEYYRNETKQQKEIRLRNYHNSIKRRTKERKQEIRRILRKRFYWFNISEEQKQKFFWGLPAKAIYQIIHAQKIASKVFLFKTRNYEPEEIEAIKKFVIDYWNSLSSEQRKKKDINEINKNLKIHMKNIGKLSIEKCRKKAKQKRLNKKFIMKNETLDLEIEVFGREIKKYEKAGWKIGKLHNKILVVNEKTGEKIKICKGELSKYEALGFKNHRIKTEVRIAIEEKEAINKTMTSNTSGKIVISNEQENQNKFVFYQDYLNTYKHLGWKIGGLLKSQRKPRKDMVRIRNPKTMEEKDIQRKELQQYKDNGWLKGPFGNAKGTIHIVNRKTSQEKMIYNNELDEYKDNGWEVGRLFKGNILVSNLNIMISKFINPNELDTYLKNGWIKGRIPKKSKAGN